jgi:hypothetical protein
MHDYFSGIAGIEKKMQQKNATDNKNISKAFQDLDRYGRSAARFTY